MCEEQIEDDWCVLFAGSEMKKTWHSVMEIEGRIYKLWRSEKGDGVGDARAMLKKGVSEKVVEIRMVSDRVMAVVLFFESC